MILQVQDLSLAFIHNQAYTCSGELPSDLDSEHLTPILHRLSFAIAESQQISLVGKSGNGKSSLLYLLAGFEKIAPNTIFWQGKDLAKMSEKEVNQLRNQDIGFIFQSHNLLPDFTALDNVVIPALIAGVDKSTAEQRGKDLLAYIGLGHRMDHYPNQLSGGERQRVAIIRALINTPKLILADEPTGNLDPENAQEVMKLINQISQDFNTSMLLVTHDQDIANSFPTKWRLDKGELSVYE